MYTATVVKSHGRSAATFPRMTTTRRSVYKSACGMLLLRQQAVASQTIYLGRLNNVSTQCTTAWITRVRVTQWKVTDLWHDHSQKTMPARRLGIRCSQLDSMVIQTQNWVSRLSNVSCKT